MRLRRCAFRRWSCQLAVLLWSVLQVPGAAADDSDRLVSAFLYQISKFVTWPPQAFTDTRPAAPLNICYCGNLSETLTLSAGELVNKRSQDRPIQSHLFPTFEALQAFYQRSGRCQLMLVGDRMVAEYARVRALDPTMLAVGRHFSFLDAGGSLALILEDNRMVIYMDPIAIERSPVKLESRLLSLVKTR